MNMPGSGLASSPPYTYGLGSPPAAGGGAGSGYSALWGGGMPLGRTISGGQGAAAGVAIVEDKHAKGRGVLRRLSLTGVTGFRVSDGRLLCLL